MAGTCIDKLPHTCGSSNGLQVFDKDGEITGYCFSCGTFVANPYGDKPEGYRPPPKPMKSEEQIQAELAAVSELPTVEDKERKLSAKSLAYFGIKTQLSEYDGVTLTAKFYPYKSDGVLTAYKIKTKDKQIYSIGSMQNVDPFGWEQAMRADNYTLYITEGEDDAVALLRTMMPRWTRERPPAIISVSSGAGSTKSITRRLSTIQRRFKQVVLVFDQDEAGQRGARKVAGLLSNCKAASFELKDANDMVKAGREDELFKAVMYEAQPLVSGKCVRSSSAWHLAEQKVEWGLPWPWPSMTELTRGRRRGEVYYFGAGVKMGCN